MDITGGAAIVTGAGTGMGAATARRFAELGCNVVVNCPIGGDDAVATVAACETAGAAAVLVKGDVTSDADCRALAQAAMDHWGRIDALVNCAGITRFVAHDDLDGLDKQDFHDIYDVNVVGGFQTIRAVAPHMKRAGHGAIVNIASTAGLDGAGSSVAYAASKGAVITMTKSLARALAPEIRVNCICPGFVATGWVTRGLGADGFERTKANFDQMLPLKRSGTADDIANAAVWICTSADFMTGEAMLLDGGQRLGINATI